MSLVNSVFKILVSLIKQPFHKYIMVRNVHHCVFLKIKVGHFFLIAQCKPFLVYILLLAQNILSLPILTPPPYLYTCHLAYSVSLQPNPKQPETIYDEDKHEEYICQSKLLYFLRISYCAHIIAYPIKSITFEKFIKNGRNRNKWNALELGTFYN